MRIDKEEPSRSDAQASADTLFCFQSTFSAAGKWISFINLLEQVIDLISAVKELHGLNSQDLYRLLRDAENFTIQYLTKKGLLLKVVPCSAS